MPLASLIGVVMISCGLILAGVVIWRAMTYRRQDKDARKPLDD